jgi:hypothetical protein
MDIALLIDGDDRPDADGGSFERVDPFTGKTATRAAAGAWRIWRLPSARSTPPCSAPS